MLDSLPSQAAAGHGCLEELSHSLASCSPSGKAPQGFQQPALPVGQKFPAWATERVMCCFILNAWVHPQAAPPSVLIPLNRFLLALYFYALERGLGERWGFPDAQTIKSPPAKQETWVQFLGQEELLEKEKATHSSILAWRIPWTEEPGRVQSMGSQRDTTE